jgi:type VI secretion system protein ImpG
MQIVFEFDTPHPRLINRIDAGNIALHAAPAVNLFDEISSQVRLDRKRHEFVVTPNSSPMSHYELHAIREVWGFYAGHQNRVPVHHLYEQAPDGQNPRQVLYFTSRRKPRRMTLQERRYGASRYRYRGTETFVSIYEPPDAERLQRLQVRAICSNRHLAEYLPIAQGNDDFTFCENQTLNLRCIAGPTPPRDSLADLESSTNHRTTAGDVYWRLISYLSLNKFGIDSPDPKAAAAALREMLSLFADLSDSVLERQIVGLQKVATRPVTRTLERADGYHAARGLEVTLTFDEDEFEGSGIILLGAVLDRFLAEHVALNSFTQTVLASVQRGQIMAFPPRSGMGPIL